MKPDQGSIGHHSRKGTTNVALLLIVVIGAIGGMLLWGLATLPGSGIRNAAVIAEQEKEQHADDVSWLVLKDAARRHLAAVRSDAVSLPDDELGDALLDYSQNGRHDFRTPRTEPTDDLAALKRAAADLDEPSAPVRCHDTIRSDDDPKCARYLDALVAVFGRDL
jgi:hypothetical protein